MLKLSARPAALFVFAVGVHLLSSPAHGADTLCPSGTMPIRLKLRGTTFKEVCMDKYEYPNKANEKPLTEVTWYKAKRLCESQGKRLCTDKEWMEACKGCKTNHQYPYGNQYDHTKCVTRELDIQNSGSRTECRSNYGIFDMVGNVAEWTSGLGVGTYGGNHKKGKRATCGLWESRSYKLTHRDVGFRCCKTLRLLYGIVETDDYCPTLDMDNDGIPDDVDKCPKDPEDPDGFEDEDGCPEKDNDHDGIPDLSDKCPKDPEDKDGFEDKDGCPDYDNDGDGIPDSTDKCPNNREDLDNYRDKDGCPDHDNDKDGIPDTVDKCPNVPENKNGVEDQDGCPEELKLEIKKPIILKGVTFYSNTAKFKPGSFEDLAMTYQTLVNHPKVYIEIRGHTDNIGTDAYNMRLSQKRANAVRSFLIRKGIAANRMVAIGMGERHPIAPNRTAAGRAENRRVEIYRTK